MSTVEKSIRLYAWKTNYHTFRIVQGEMDSRRFNIQLFSTTIPVTLHDCHVCFYAVKPDGKKAYLECEILDADTGLVSVELSAQVCAVDGTVDCWIQVVSDAGTDLRFEGMNIEVGECDLNESAESSNDFGFLTTAIAEMRPATARANEAAARANASADNADKATAESDAQTAKAKTATTNAEKATTAANTAKANADKATTSANQAATAAEQAKANADSAAQAAINAANAANKAKSNADTATTAANKAAASANEAAETVRDAVQSADQAAQSASQAVANANQAVSQAQQAVTNANDAVYRSTVATANAENASIRASSAAAEASAAAEEASNAIDEVSEEAHEFIVQELAKRNQVSPEYAESLDELNSSGDTSKLYVLPDGMIYAYTKKTSVSGGGKPLFTNALDSVELKLNQRWSHSTKEFKAATGYVVTGLIPVQAEQTVYVNRRYVIGQHMALCHGYSRCQYYTSSGNYITGEFDRTMHLKIVITDHPENGTASFVVGRWMTTSGDASTDAPCAGASQIAYMRLVININGEAEVTQDMVDDLIISVGNPIAYSEPESSVTYGWTSTGHAFVPADYEQRIVDVEQALLEQSLKLVEIEKSVQTGGSDATETAALNRIMVWDRPVFDPAPVTLLSEARNKPALTSQDRTIEAIYAKYRKLAQDYPDYVTEINMGASSSSATFAAVDMLRFDFRERDGLTDQNYKPSELHETKPKLIFLSGIHKEWAGVWALYYALEEIVTNPDFDDVRRNAHIIVIPCANPYGLTDQASIEGWTMSHVNANGVAIHNNFYVGHKTTGAVGEYNYGGPSPYSELETQHIDKVMADNPDAVAFVSCHNNDYSTMFGSPVIWASSATYHMCNVAFRLIDKLSKAWLEKYGQELKDSIDSIKMNMPANEYRLGRAMMSTSAGTEQRNATRYGIQGVNLEISRMMKVFSGNVDGTTEVMTRGAEVYANFMRTLLWAFDQKDKKDYAPNLPWKY